MITKRAANAGPGPYKQAGRQVVVESMRRFLAKSNRPVAVAFAGFLAEIDLKQLGDDAVWQQTQEILNDYHQEAGKSWS